MIVKIVGDYVCLLCLQSVCDLAQITVPLVGIKFPNL